MKPRDESVSPLVPPDLPSRAAIVAILRRDNPAARAVDVAMYADAYLSYREAQANIEANGAICAHPRTGQPIDNPYLKVRASASAALRKLARIRDADALWSA